MSASAHLFPCLAVLALALAAAPPASAEPVEIPEPDGVVLKAELFRPAGPPAAPAIVALHGCGGAYPKRDRQWTAALTEAGHIMLFPDSFASHGLGPQCRVRDRIAGYRELRRQDALTAAAWLAAEKATPAGGVVLMGWSDGGGTVLAAGIIAADLPAGLLRGLVAFYPACERAVKNGAWNFAAPLLILSGANDDWDAVGPCRELAAHAGPALELVSYPGAYHDFDVDEPVHVLKNVAFSQNADGSVHVGGDPAARADALQRVPAFIVRLPPAAP
ncbi:MAG TPA: dienelactone hydrolase family protein [Alphaproteobacteria bacterium]|nr:dienelactone hydrolase family protein [Alphaproteobacteria bacterium]